jgi:hypothetical protein
MENEIDQEVDETTEVEETETNDVQEEVEVEKPKLTLEQQRGILQRKLTKLNKELGIEEKPVKKETETPKNAGIDLKDIRALQDVPDEDVDEVIDYAKFKGISIAEAKKNPVMQTVLKTRAEERKTAEATNTSSTRRSSSKVSDEDLLDKLSKNEVPEEDLDKAIAARLERRKKGNSNN